VTFEEYWDEGNIDPREECTESVFSEIAAWLPLDHEIISEIHLT
jgi:hypothetical protein